jgi:hypothetical protein
VTQARSSRLLAIAGKAFLASGWCIMLLVIVVRIADAQARESDWLIALAIGASLILTGCSALMLAALDRGFGALDRFFQEALARSARRASDLAQQTQTSEPLAEQRGMLGDRPYVVESDGSVIVETLLGMRRFGSLREAEEFVGA